jgi:RecJ-like exonuclease
MGGNKMKCPECNGFGYTPPPHSDVCKICKGKGVIMTDELRERFEKKYPAGEDIYWNKDHYSGVTSSEEDNHKATLHNTRLEVHLDNAERIQRLRDALNLSQSFISIVRICHAGERVYVLSMIEAKRYDKAMPIISQALQEDGE